MKTPNGKESVDINIIKKCLEILSGGALGYIQKYQIIWFQKLVVYYMLLYLLHKYFISS